MSVTRQVLAAIKKYDMVGPGEKVLVAVSGGPDSMALMHILYRLQDRLGIKLHVFHLDHLFRGEESAGDARLVKNTAGYLGLPCTIEKYDVQEYCTERGKSKQEGAREVRYEFISRVSAGVGAGRVAQGHHGDDQVETMLLNFLRGAGLTGLKGFLPVRDDFYIRPLINLRRRDIEDYCRRHEINYRVDSSNQEPVYTRNRLRLDLIPRLKHYNPSLVNTLMRTAEVLREEDEFLEEAAGEVFSRAVSTGKERSFQVDVEMLLAEPLALQRRVLRKLWTVLTGDPGGIGFEHMESVLNLLQNGGGSWEVHLPGGVCVSRRYNNLWLSRLAENAAEIPPYNYPLQVPGDLHIPELGLTVKARILPAGRAGDPEMLPPGEVILDYDKMKGDLFVRRRLPGDRFRPLGLDGAEVKLKKFFIDHKIPREERDRIPLVTCGGEIAWVAGIRPAEIFKYTGKSNNVLYLRIDKKGTG